MLRSGKLIFRSGMTALAIVIGAHGLWAQVPGKLRLLVDPGHNYQFKVDGGPAQQVREIELQEGQHQFRFWAPGRLVIDTTLMVVPDRLTNTTVRLPIDQIYTAYRMDLRSFKRKKRAIRGIPFLVSAGALGWTVASWKQHNDAYTELQDRSTEYGSSVSPSRIAELKNEIIPEAKENLRQTGDRFALASAVSVACAAATAYFFARSGRWERPVYDDQQKIRFEGLAYAPIDMNNVWAFHFNFSFR